MHEVSIMQSTLDIAIEQASGRKAKKILGLSMRVGQLSGVVPEALRFAFDVLTQGTIAEGASLDVELVSVVCYCSACEKQFDAADMFCECPRCHQTSIQIVRGRELQLKAIEVE
jgi:hydrogenase nickel incorporation protein HypA/HybF